MVRQIFFVPILLSEIPSREWVETGSDRFWSPHPYYPQDRATLEVGLPAAVLGHLQTYEIVGPQKYQQEEKAKLLPR